MAERTTIADGQLAIRKGVHSGLARTDVPENGHSWAVNVQHRNGIPRTRPGFNLVRRHIVDEFYDTIEAALAVHPGCDIQPTVRRILDTTAVTIPTNYPTTITNYPIVEELPVGALQGGCVYTNKFNFPRKYVLLVIAGRIYLQEFLSAGGFTLTELTSGAAVLSTTKPVNVIQADTYAIFQDGESIPMIWDGATLRQADQSNPSAPEVPIGFWMAYGSGRLWVAQGDRLFAGDIYGGPTSVITFSEDTYLATYSGFKFREDITGLAFVPKIDSATGHGALLVWTRNTTNSILAEITARSTWTSNVMQTVIFGDIGCLSGRSIVKVNQDVVWRSKAGIHSLKHAVSIGNTDLTSNTPIGEEVSRILDRDSQEHAAWVPAVFADNRLLMGATPVQGQFSVAARCLAVLDYRPAASINSKEPPAWDGIWTGCHPAFILQAEFDGADRTLLYCADQNDITGESTNRMWELTRNEFLDDGMKPIASSIETRGFVFGSKLKLKILRELNLSMIELWGLNSVIIEFRPDGEMCWFKWTAFSRCVKISTTPGVGVVPKNYSPGYKQLLKTVEAPDSSIPMTDIPSNRGFSFQVRITWLGHAGWDRLLLTATEEVDHGMAYEKV